MKNKISIILFNTAPALLFYLLYAFVTGNIIPSISARFIIALIIISCILSTIVCVGVEDHYKFKGKDL